MPVLNQIDDVERKTTFNVTSNSGPFAFGFPLYDDDNSSDPFIIKLDGLEQSGWTLDLGTATGGAYLNATVTPPAAVTGQVDLVGRDRPHRDDNEQFAEGVGVPAASHNTILNRAYAIMRETWDRLDSSGTVRNGSGAPATTVGEVNDFYIDTAASALYGPKTSSGWGSATSLVGATGATGATGPAGADGADGANGTDGQAGADLGIPYAYEANTADSDQGAGKIWFNNADPASATKLFISETDADGTDVSTFIGLIGDSTNPAVKAHFELRSPTTRGKWVMGQITADAVDDGAYREFAIASVTRGTALVDADAISFVARTVGNVGTGSSTDVATIAALTAQAKSGLSDGVLVHVTDRTRGGHFVWDAESNDTADGGTILEADEGGTGRWKRNYNQADGIHSDWYPVDTDATLGLQDALDAINAAGLNSSPIVFILDKASYTFSGGGLVVPNNIGLKGKNHTTITASTNHTPFDFRGTRNTTESNTLASDASAGTRTLALSTGKGANFTKDQRVLVGSNDTMWTGNTQKAGEYVRIFDVTGDTLTLYSPLRYSYTTANSAEVQKINWQYGATLENLTIQYSDATISTNICVAFQQCYEPKVTNCWAKENRFTGFAFYGCFRPHIKGGGAEDLVSDTASNYLGYGIAFAGLNWAPVVEGFTAISCRHLGTTVGSASLAPYGVPVQTRYIACVGIDMKLTHHDTHAESDETEYISCSATGGLASGFQLRGRNDKVSGGNASNLHGAAAFIVANSERCVVDGLSSQRTNLGTNSEDSITWTDEGAIYVNGIDTTIRNVDVYHCGGPGIKAGANASGRHRWSNCVVKDPCQISTSHTYAMGTLGTNAFELTIVDPDTSASDTNTDYGVRVTSGNVDLSVHGGRFTDTQIALVDVDNNDHRVFGIDGVGMISYGITQNIAVSSNEIDVGNVTKSASFNITGTGAQTITHIRGGADGCEIFLHRASVNFTLDSGAGGDDEIFGPGFADVLATSSSHTVKVKRKGADWHVSGTNF